MRYYEKIDGLRFVAISAVLIHHMASVFSTYIDWGYFGVDLFFVISGFLITIILLRAQGSFKQIYGNFMARRALRIFPLYYFVLLILFFMGNPVVREEFIYLVSYTFNYQSPFITEHNPVEHFWSLCVEEQFYFFWPFLIIFLRKRINLLTVVILVLVGFAYSQIHFNIIPSLKIYNYAGLPSRMGSLGLGGLGAILFLNEPNRMAFFLKDFKIEMLLFLIFIISLFYRIPILMGLSSLFFVLKAASNSFQTRWINKMLVHKKVLYMGRISYGMYIYHVPIIFYLTPYVFDPFWNNLDFDAMGPFSILKYHSWIVKFPLYLSITIAISSLSYYYFEKPILVLKDKFFKPNRETLEAKKA